jgi:hypothetical protein
VSALLGAFLAGVPALVMIATPPFAAFVAVATLVSVAFAAVGFPKKACQSFFP